MMATKTNVKTKTKPAKETKEQQANKEAYEPYRKMLLKRREELCSSVKNHAEELPDTGMEGAAGDSSDHAAADFTSEMFGALLERQAGTLEEVERALKKMDDGTYGICEICEKPIPSKRIKALPWARFCLDCQQKQDRRNAMRRTTDEREEWEAGEGDSE
jgi:DnaK suppressor protein